jgi:hypothetical protein
MQACAYLAQKKKQSIISQRWQIMDTHDARPNINACKGCYNESAFI